MQRSSSIRFKPLLGVGGEEPLCYLLQIDDFRILLDCGWDDEFDPNQLSEVAKEIEKGVDAVLLSYPDLAHLGGLAYCVGKLGLEANVYATTPVWKMGQMFMYDAHQSQVKARAFDSFNLDDVDNAFDDSRTDRVMLKYSQRMHIGAGIEVTPLVAGHMIGGTVWKIQKEIEEILYAVDFNHKKERHLNRSLLELQFRPSLLITDAFSALDTNTVQRQQRDRELVELLQQTVAQQGDVLMPVDTAGRVLEMALFLEMAAATLNESVPRGGAPVSVAVCSEMAFRSIEQAKSQLEWMSDWVMSCFDKNRENPFVFTHVQCCQSLEEIASLPSPRIVLASMLSMQYGFSRELFSRWADKPKNLVLFTERSRKGTLAYELMTNPTSHTRTLKMHRRIPLEGAELAAFLKQKEEESLVAEQKEEDEEMEDVKPQATIVDDTELEAIIPSLPNPYFVSSCDLIVGRDDTSKDGAYPMFPFEDKRPVWDDYGVPLEPGEYTVPDEGLQDRMETVDSAAQEEEEEEEEEEEAPTKAVVEDLRIDVRCKVHYIDFEGRSDGRSVRNIITNIAPRKLILVHGEEQARQELQRDLCSGDNSRTIETVLVAEHGKELDVTTDTSIWKVELKDALMQTLDFTEVDGYEVTYLDALVSLPSTADGDTVMAEADAVVKEEDSASISFLSPVEEHRVPGHEAVFVGDLLLKEFKRVLAEHNISVAFQKGGVLLCNEVIKVRKVGKAAGQTEFEVEGPLCDEYYFVRELLYNQFCLL